jgi:hypothetical protein
MRMVALVLLLAGVGVLAVACEDEETPTPPPFSEGVVATFLVTGESFSVWVTNDSTIEQLEALQEGTGSGFPNGRLLSGPGQADHNAPWGWHLDPDETEIVDVTIELCDGRPSFVQDDLDYWLNTVGRFCPWDAQLTGLNDYR